MYVVIIDYGTGNLKSVYRALQHAGKNIKNLKIVISNSIKEIKIADRIILPGQGSYKQCVDSIIAIKGLWETINNQVNIKKKPIFGICVGMQLFSIEGHEEEKTNGFGWINGTVKKITSKSFSFKLPHIGKNNVKILNKKNIFNNIKNNSHFFFVHSYEFITKEKNFILATCDYGKEIIVSINKDNIFGTQFHPEKSQENGIKLLSNFLNYNR